MTVLTLGLNHHTAAVDLRGRFAFAVEQLSPALRQLHERLAAPHAVSAQPEVALLSTCNRTELYCSPGGLGASAGAVRHAAIEWLGKRGKAVKKLRFIPAERAHAIARKLQGQAGTTVSVL